jgi:cytochrome c oxidase subunit 4
MAESHNADHKTDDAYYREADPRDVAHAHEAVAAPRAEDLGGTADAHGHVHVVPLKVLIGVFVALLILTVLTVAAREIDLGALNIWLALGIALVKAAFVALWFMHLRYDSLFNGIILVGALLFVVVFIAIAMLDTQHYQPDIIEWTPQSELSEQASD